MCVFFIPSLLLSLHPVAVRPRQNLPGFGSFLGICYLCDQDSQPLSTAFRSSFRVGIASGVFVPQKPLAPIALLSGGRLISFAYETTKRQVITDDKDHSFPPYGVGGSTVETDSRAVRNVRVGLLPGCHFRHNSSEQTFGRTAAAVGRSPENPP